MSATRRTVKWESLAWKPASDITHVASRRVARKQNRPRRGYLGPMRLGTEFKMAASMMSMPLQSHHGQGNNAPHPASQRRGGRRHGETSADRRLRHRYGFRSAGGIRSNGRSSR